MFTVPDKSNYLKGLLILARKDEQLVDDEKNIIRTVAQKFGFSKDFYEDTLKSLMTNKYITEEPILFSSRHVAELFLEDGFRLAFSDEVMHNQELEWLKIIAYANGIEDEYFETLLLKHHILGQSKEQKD
jgi:hypothetical protein